MDQVTSNAISHAEERKKLKNNANQKRYRERQKSNNKTRVKANITRVAHVLLREIVEKTSSTNKDVIAQAICNQTPKLPNPAKVVTEGPLIGNIDISEWVDDVAAEKLQNSFGPGKKYRTKDIALSAFIYAYYFELQKRGTIV